MHVCGHRRLGGLPAAGQAQHAGGVPGAAGRQGGVGAGTLHGGSQEGTPDVSLVPGGCANEVGQGGGSGFGKGMHNAAEVMNLLFGTGDYTFFLMKFWKV